MPAVLSARARGPVRQVPGPVRRERPGGYQPGFIGEHDRLDAVAQAQLGEYPADMDLHGALGQVQRGRDLAVGHASRDAGEDVLLAAGEGAAYLGGALPAGRLGRPTGSGELADEALGGARREDGVTGGDGAD